MTEDHYMTEDQYQPETDEPQDTGEEANDIRFSEEQQLIREQTQGRDADLKGGDASDDPAHYGKEQ